MLSYGQWLEMKGKALASATEHECWLELRKEPNLFSWLPHRSDKLGLEALKQTDKVYLNAELVYPHLINLTEEMVFEMIFNGGMVELPTVYQTDEYLWIQYIHSQWQQGSLPIPLDLIKRKFPSLIRLTEDLLFNDGLTLNERWIVISGMGDEDKSYRQYRYQLQQQPKLKWFSPYHALEVVEEEFHKR